MNYKYNFMDDYKTIVLAGSTHKSDGRKGEVYTCWVFLFFHL